MFSRAKRFDYYPKPEDKPKRNCDRCLEKHSKLAHKDPNTSSLNNSRASIRRSNRKKLNGTMRKEKIRRSSSTDDGFVDNRKNSYSTDPGSSSSSIFDEIQVSRSPSPGNVMNQNTRLGLLQVTDLDDETVYDSILEVPATPLNSQSVETDLLHYLDTMEKKISDHRRRIELLKRQLISSSGNEGFHSIRSASPSDVTVEERIRHVEDMSRFCIKETLDFITMYNKNLEAKCTSRPQDYKDLVEFCTELITEVSGKLSSDKKSKKKFKKVKGFFKSVVSPFRKMSKMFKGK